jgi:hypothetical protein
MTLEIEVGKAYRRRDGGKETICENDGGTMPWRGEGGYWFYPDGRLAGGCGAENPQDLIAPWDERDERDEFKTENETLWGETARLQAENARLTCELAEARAALALAEADAAEYGRGAAEMPFDLVAHLSHQRDWSRETFGPGARTAGVIDHIRKELAEIEAAPDDITEWVDVIILAFDGAWRAGWEPEAIVKAITAKQAKNKAWQWPDWRKMSQDQAIEHVREPAAIRALDTAPSETGGKDAP